MPDSSLATQLGFAPEQLPREMARHYIPASAADLAAMLREVGLERLEDLYEFIPAEVRFVAAPDLPEELAYADLPVRLAAVAEKNVRRTSFLGDGLPQWKQQPIVAAVAGIRNLATSYTPYQPERSQGTLLTQWIYQCALSMLTGFEAINTSLYDRASGLYEAVACALRLAPTADTVLVPEALYPGDLEVLRTLASDTEIQVVTLPLDPATGRIDRAALEARAIELGARLGAVVFPQVNTLGLLEDVDALTDLCARLGVRSIAVIDPILLCTGGLKPPSAFGRKGADMIVGEAQHLALAPNFGGPGLGLFGVRYNEAVKNDIRQAPGRYVGKARDLAGRDCRVMILSTREQHIRKDKATSNICSNQAFVATLAGASLLARGEAGLSMAVREAYMKARGSAARLQRLPGVRLAWPEAPFFQEITLELDRPVADVLRAGRAENLHLGVDVGDRIAGGRHLLKISFSDVHSARDVAGLIGFFEKTFGPPAADPRAHPLPDVAESFWRQDAVGLPEWGEEKVREYYEALGRLNVAPETTCYPLGSCTMKYNPYVNEWAAGLEGFTQAHPQAPVEDVQGCLEIIYETQEWFKGITGLAAVTTQPVAGAQGELVGLKLFQAYHRARGEGHRNVILIPGSAHGTNFATAVMAGYPNRMVEGKKAGIVLLEAEPSGRIDQASLDRALADHAGRVAGIMVTNPNTGGIFESEFKTIAEKVHAAGGLVYMDGANMNAIAGWINLGAMGVDAVHNNTHKTWTIPHGGGGPGDAFVAVSARLAEFLPGYQVVREADGTFRPVRPPRSIGSFHRHWGNFAHKVRAYTYLLRLGREGVRRMSAVAVLSSRYLFTTLRRHYPALPPGADAVPRMHEFILTLEEADFARLEKAGVPRAQAIPRVGKLFLDFGYHAPTVAFPEVFGLMIEPTESYRKEELDRFAEAVRAIQGLLREHPEVLAHAPWFTPIERVDDVAANRAPVTWEPLRELPPIHPNRVDPRELVALPVEEVTRRILAAHAARS